MISTAPRRTRTILRPKLVSAPPRELFTEGVLPVQVVPNGRVRGHSLVRSLSVQLTYAAIDAVFVCIVGAAMVALRFGLANPAQRHAFSQGAGHTYVGFFLLYAALVVLGCANQNLYRTPRDRSVLDETLMVARAVGAATALLILFIFIAKYNDISRIVILSAGALNVLTLSGWRYFKRQRVLSRSASGIGVSRVLIVGAGRPGMALASWFEANPHLGYHVCGFLDSKASSDARVLGSLKDLRTIALTQFADELFVTLPADRELVKTIVVQARELHLGLKLLPDLYDGLGWRAPLHTIGGFPVMDLQWQPIPAVGLAMKRAFDVVFASLCLVLLSPFLLLLTLLIRLDSPGPILYIADRVGYKGNRFRFFKFRTMCVDADAQKEELRDAENERERGGPLFKLEEDPRVTRFGRWLRRTSFDELPQLWNVLRGEMSMVGPRPHSVDDYARYSLENVRRLDVTPGLTGLWQVTARNSPSWETNMALDLEYIENWSLGLDIKILLKTIPAVLRAEGR
jgi:exopolysaccharide biosynthesis polyprenyl glycosylphosphotransferase